MEEENINSHPDLFTSLKDLEATPREPEQPVAIALTPTEWPVLPDSLELSLPARSVQPGQRTPNYINNNSSATPFSRTIKRKTAEEHEKDRVGKYVAYFQGTTILSILDLVAAVEHRTLSLIVTDLRTRRLAGLKKRILRGASHAGFKKESFGEHPMLVFLPAKLRHLGCPAASEDLASKLAGNNITTKYFQLQYKGKQTIRVTVCNVPIQLNGDVLAAYLSKYGSVAAVTPLKAFDGTAHGDYILTVSLDKEGF